MMKPEAQELMNAFPNVKSLIEGSHVSGSDLSGLLEHWIQNRKPICGAIEKSGTLLDIGCANGFLLACLQLWSEYQITPYGVDVDAGSLEMARDLLPEYASHFAQLPLGELSTCASFGLPTRFDYVYWNVWDGLDFNEPLYQTYAENAFAAARDGGRLILGFYDTDHDAVSRQIEWLVGRFGTYSKRLKLDTEFAWWDCEPRE
jgi:SAM-dependent methyltransferase